MNIVATAPKISAESADFYRRHIPASLNRTATFILDAFPSFYRSTLAEMRGLFSRGELGLILDVLNGHGMLILAAHHSPAIIGHAIAIEVEDAIRLSMHLKDTWKIDDTADFLSRIGSLTHFQKIVLEIWAAGFWVDRDTDMEEWIKPLMSQNGEDDV